jgi:hypothetical protein
MWELQVMRNGFTFRYDNQVWLVIGKGAHDGFYRCINPQGKIRQFNRHASR